MKKAFDLSWPSLSVERADGNLRQLLQSVHETTGRIEITDGASDAACVMISRTELDHLERAIALLSDADEVRVLCRALARVAGRAEGADPPAGY